MRLLLIEDDRRTAGFVCKGFKEAGFTVDRAANGPDGFHLLSTEPYAAAVVDIMLPGLSGLDVVENARRQGVKTPVIFLSAKREVDERVEGLQAGGDDYLVKPFAFAELLARVRALIRRASGATELTRLRIGGLEMDLTRRKVAWCGKTFELQPREFALLQYLARNPDMVISKTMIMENVWDYNFDPQTNVVEACICRLRNRLREACGQDLVRTIRGAGYVLESRA